MTFEEAVAQIEAAVREHGARVEELVVRVRNGAIPEARFVAEMVSLRQAFEKVVGELTSEAKSSALASIASLKVPESQRRNWVVPRACANGRLLSRERETPFEQSSDRVILVGYGGTEGGPLSWGDDGGNNVPFPSRHPEPQPRFGGAFFANERKARARSITFPPKPAGGVAKRLAEYSGWLLARLELRWCLASFRGMTEFVFEPPLRLVREVSVRTLDDAADFARTYVGPRLPQRRDRLVRRLQEISDDASARIAARAFRTWAIDEGLLAEET
jgi:hypothetical protein